MRQGKEMLGMPVIACDSGAKLGTVKEVVIRRTRPSVVGFLLRKGNWLRQAQIVPLSEVVLFGDLKLTIGSSKAISGLDEALVPQRLLEQEPLIGSSLISANGHEVGQISDFYFDEHSGEIEGFDVVMGFLTDASPKPEFLPLDDDVSIGRNSVLISAQTYDRLMFDATEQVRSNSINPAVVAGVQLNATMSVPIGLNSGLTALSQFSGLSCDKRSL